MGTRFCATQEAPIHETIKQQVYLANDERGTHLIFRKFRNTGRVGKTAVSDAVMEIFAKPDSTFEDVAHLVAGAKGDTRLKWATTSASGFRMQAEAQGLIHDIPHCAELVARIVRDAEAIITDRLSRFRRG